MIDGKLPLPSKDDPLTRAAVQTAIARYEKKQAAAGKTDPNAVVQIQRRSRPPLRTSPSRLRVKSSTTCPLTDEQKAELLNGTAGIPASHCSNPCRTPNLSTFSKLCRSRSAIAFPTPDLPRCAAASKSSIRRIQVVNRDLSEGKLLRAIYSNRQLEEVLTDFWFNHFNVYLDKGADRFMVTAYERDVIRPHVLGKFKDLLLATAESPAMLFYLDNWQSVGTRRTAAQCAEANAGPERELRPRADGAPHARRRWRLHPAGRHRSGPLLHRLDHPPAAAGRRIRLQSARAR